MSLCPDSEISILSTPSCISQYVSHLSVSFPPINLVLEKDLKWDYQSHRKTITK